MKKIALLGQPNSGKSTVFNALTGSRQHVGNWPGKTVEKCEGTFKFEGETYSVIDLPGSYGMTGNSDEEKITADYINSKQADLVCILVDESQLERSMYMTADFASACGAPAILLLNMSDVAKRKGIKVDEEKIKERLGIPVLPFVAAERKYYANLKQTFKQELDSPHTIKTKPADNTANAKYDWIKTILDGATENTITEYKMSKFDRAATSPVLGKIIALGVILASFMVAMCICSPFMSIGAMLPSLLNEPIANLLNGWGVHPWLVSIFSLIIPNVIYFAISMASFALGINFMFGLLEEIGYLARIAFQFDKTLSRMGLQGKAVCPILMGFGCTIAGACGSRVMDNWGQRMLAMAIVWAVPCGSIWTVVPVIASMFFPTSGVVCICLGILVYMVVLMVVVSKIFGKKLSPEQTRSGMIMELPPYHRPHIWNVFKEACLKAWDIFLRALRVITLVSLLFWVFSYSSTGNIEDSLLYKVGTTIEPVTKFFGLGWQTFMGFLTSAFAKEAILGVLNAIFVGQNSLVEATFNAQNTVYTASTISQIMPEVISKPEALAFLFACTFNIPCVMALSTTYRESHSLKWTARVALFYIAGALILSCIVYHIACLFM